MSEEYIERYATIESIKGNCAGCESYGGVLCTSCPLYDALLQLEYVPAADVAPVVHGEWIICSDGYYPYCSVCIEKPDGRKMTKFCPNCGAKMDRKR